MDCSMCIKVIFTSADAAQSVQQRLEERGDREHVTHCEDSQITVSLHCPSVLQLKCAAPSVLDELLTVSRESSTDAAVSSATCNCSVQCTVAREAYIICNSLQVDREPKRSKTRKLYSLRDQTCVIDVVAPDVRELRTATNSLLDLLHLTVDTIARFGPPRPAPKRVCSPPLET
ncbi:CTAG/Pcc1 family [Trinorchestia longiramus]|nr:CTAG/Pcc1 family [Trinorchestia longiramus]